VTTNPAIRSTPAANNSGGGAMMLAAPVPVYRSVSVEREPASAAQPPQHRRQFSNQGDDAALAQALSPDPVRDAPRLSEPLSHDDPDYQRATNEFLKTCGDTHFVVGVRRVLGAPLRRVQYSLLKRTMDARGGSNEQWLWHGTDAGTVAKIVANGFNRSFSRTAAFGKGVYFAVDARYSANPKYATPDPGDDGLQSMLRARVLVGRHTRGRPEMVAPPPLPGAREGELFDSLVDRPSNPRVVVSCHNDNQALPEQVVEFLPLQRSHGGGLFRAPAPVFQGGGAAAPAAGGGLFGAKPAAKRQQSGIEDAMHAEIARFDALQRQLDGVLPVPVPTRDVAQQQQRLLLLRHASKCQAPPGRCTRTSLCAQTKILWQHIATCKNPACPTPRCVSSRRVLSHYHSCKDPTCAVCTPVRNSIQQATQAARERQQPGLRRDFSRSYQDAGPLALGRDVSIPPTSAAATAGTRRRACV